LYRNRVEHIKREMPNACIGVDVIVGYPGETEEAFMETVNLLKSLDVSYFHVFTYSERANTTALRMNEVVPMHVRQERNKVLTMLSHKKKRAFYESQSNSEQEVLWEASENEGMMQGFTKNYVKVQRKFDSTRINKIEHIQLGSVQKNGLHSLVEEPSLVV
ncbi:MAG: tRNA (N(6)-L-threonylcarbamoyladenosine(37)-C(2))-methylthiotransferase MtaB, partial [Salibacteraceae bacterium]